MNEIYDTCFEVGIIAFTKIFCFRCWKEGCFVWKLFNEVSNRKISLAYNKIRYKFENMIICCKFRWFSLL